MNKNWWGEPDDIEPLPEWMDPRTYQNNNQFQSNGLTKYVVNTEQILNSCNILFVKTNNDRFLFYNF